MSINHNDVENISHLARLHLEASEIEESTKSISNILTLINEMQSVETDDVSPLSHAFDSAQRLREDIVTEQDNRDELQKIAPNIAKGLFLVPKVLE